MIVVTRLNGSRLAVNLDLIERVQASPDTTIVLVGGSTYIVRESLDEVLARIDEYRARILDRAWNRVRHLPATSAPAGEVVPFRGRRGDEVEGVR